MKVVLLCGGMGTRLREQTEFMPKPLVEIGGMPILQHIMKIYSHYGHNEFVLCLGYKGDMIKEYFKNSDWNITFADTGLETNTGGRIKKIEKYVDGDTFMCTYGDGVSNIDLNKLLEQHEKMAKIATLTAIHPMSRFGIIETEDGLVKSFKEKPRLDGIINGGFFVFNKDVFDYLDDNSVLEQEPLKNLSKDNQLAVYEHQDFWECMDTFKDAKELNQMWDSGNVPWRIWE